MWKQAASTSCRASFPSDGVGIDLGILASKLLEVATSDAISDFLVHSEAIITNITRLIPPSSASFSSDEDGGDDRKIDSKLLEVVATSDAISHLSFY